MEDLSRRVERLEHELEKTRAMLEVQNLFARYMYLHNAGKNQAAGKLFAQKTPGTTIEFHSCGLLRGESGMQKMYGPEAMGAPVMPKGFMIEHTLTTPVVEVAEDLCSAKGIWISPGHETQPKDRTAPEKGMVAQWAWFRYGVDFVREEGEWKIWHYQVFRTFLCPYDTPWTDPSTWERRPVMPFADAPTTYYNAYSADYEGEYWPAPPEPYDSFAGTRSMVGAPPEGFDL